MVAAANAAVVWPEGKELFELLPLASFEVLEEGPLKVGSAYTFAL